VVAMLESSGARWRFICPVHSHSCSSKTKTDSHLGSEAIAACLNHSPSILSLSSDGRLRIAGAVSSDQDLEDGLKISIYTALK
jgi:hypothetical protein